MNIRTSMGVLLVALSAAACSTRTDATGAPQKSVTGGACTPEAECSACGTCFDGCLCGGGSSARCAEACSTAPGGAPGGETDAGAPDGAVSRPEGPLVGTLVPQAIDIPAGQEYFRCQDFANPFGRDTVVLSSESFMTAGSHHMFVFQKTGAQNGDMEPCSGLEFSSFIHLAQRSEERVTYPPGVGRFLAGGDGLRVQIHYLNSTNAQVHAEIAVTIRADVPEAVPVHASQIFMNTLSINVPPFSKGSASEQCGVPNDVNVFTAASHMHQHGVHFTARADDGQLLYETNQWAEPAPWTFTPPRKLRAGSVIHVGCDYENTTSASLSFGESAATNEMCIFAASYYPAADGESITCLF